MLYNLSLKNIKKSFKDYAIYFVTLILGVCIFYLFNSMDSQTAILEVTSRQSEMIDLLEQILSYISVFVSFILGFLIIFFAIISIFSPSQAYYTDGIGKTRKYHETFFKDAYIDEKDAESWKDYKGY